MKQQRAEEDIAQIRERIENHRKQAAELPDVAAEDRNDLLQLFESADSAFDKDTDRIDAAARKASKTLSTETSQTQGKLNDIRSAAEKILHDFRTRWPEAAADFDDSFEDREAYLDIFRRIRANGLPSYEKQFMKVLHDFSQDQITALASTIRGAFREVKDRLYPVNRSLELSEYSPHIHLQIEAKDNRSKQVNDFLAELQEITRGTWSEDDLASAEARYHRTEQIIRRFTSVEYADRVWKNACLDTRQHVSFIAKEIDESGAVQDVHSSDAGLSGGQKQKLVIFCLAAALRYQLADEDQRTPSYGTVVLDEAFDKADYRFASSAMDIFEVFGFHMVLATRSST